MNISNTHKIVYPAILETRKFWAKKKQKKNRVPFLGKLSSGFYEKAGLLATIKKIILIPTTRSF